MCDAAPVQCTSDPECSFYSPSIPVSFSLPSTANTPLLNNFLIYLLKLKLPKSWQWIQVRRPWLPKELELKCLELRTLTVISCFPQQNVVCNSPSIRFAKSLNEPPSICSQLVVIASCRQLSPEVKIAILPVNHPHPHSPACLSSNSQQLSKLAHRSIVRKSIIAALGAVPRKRPSVLPSITYLHKVDHVITTSSLKVIVEMRRCAGNCQ